MTTQTWTITDIDGGNARTVTLAEYLAEVRAASAKARAIHAGNVAKVRRATSAA